MRDKLLIGFFAVVLGATLFLNLSGASLFKRADENRAFHDSIRLDLPVRKWPTEVDHYVNDNFVFRTPLLHQYHHLQTRYLKVSPKKDQLIIGKDNWYFMAEKEIKLFEGRDSLTLSQRAEMKTIWQQRQQYFDSLDIPVFWMIAPIKHYVYPEYLPFYYHQKGETNTKRLQRDFKSFAPNLIIDPTSDLRAAKEQTKVYFQNDNHWNEAGGYVASKAIYNRIKALVNDSLIFPEVIMVDTIATGGIHKTRLGDTELTEVTPYPVVLNSKVQVAEKYGFTPPDGFAYKNLYESRFVNPAANNRLKVLVIRDSFGKQTFEVLPELFYETVYIFDAWRYNFHPEIIAEIQPDIVLFIGLEMHLENVIKNAHRDFEKPE